VFLAHWPYFWVAPSSLPDRLVELHANVAQRSGRFVMSWYPLIMVLYTTPPVVLLLAAAALAWLPLNLRRTRGDQLLFALYVGWFATVLVAFSSGAVDLFDGIRHFIHFWPPLAILSGWGAVSLWSAAARRVPALSTAVSRAVGAAILLAAVLPGVAMYHPFEVTYFNVLAGGLPGATALRFGPDVLEFEPRDYWGTSLRRAVKWANENLPAGARVSVSVPPRFHRVYGFRSDLEPIVPTLAATDYLLFVNRPRFFRRLERFALRRGELVHVESVQGVPLCFVFRLDVARNGN